VRNVQRHTLYAYSGREGSSIIQQLYKENAEEMT